jgi:hypothetical protein
MSSKSNHNNKKSRDEKEHLFSILVGLLLVLAIVKAALHNLIFGVLLLLLLVAAFLIVAPYLRLRSEVSSTVHFYDSTSKISFISPFYSWAVKSVVFFKLNKPSSTSSVNNKSSNAKLAILLMTSINKSKFHKKRLGVAYVYEKTPIFSISIVRNEIDYKRILIYNKINSVLTNYYWVFSLEIRYLDDSTVQVIKVSAVPIANDPYSIEQNEKNLIALICRYFKDTNCTLRYDDYSRKLIIHLSDKVPLGNLNFAFEKYVDSRKTTQRSSLIVGLNIHYEIQYWNMQKDQAHMLVAGMTGSGKTSCMQSLALQAALLDYDVKVCDPKSVDFYSFREYTNCAFTKEEMSNVISNTFQEMQKRYQKRELNTRVILLVIDEFREILSIFKNDDVIEMINAIAFKGRAANVFLCVGIQRPDAALIGGFMRDNFGYRVNFKMLSPSSYRMMWQQTEINGKPIEDVDFAPGIAISGVHHPEIIRSLYINNIDRTLALYKSLLSTRSQPSQYTNNTPVSD